MKNTKKTSRFPGIFVMFIILIFLSGKIIHIPKGTHRGGIISATGVFLIITVTVLIQLLINKKKRDTKIQSKKRLTK